MILANDTLIQRIVDRLHDPDPTTRRNAVAALRLNGERSMVAMTALNALLDDNDPFVRSEVRRTLDLFRSVAA